MTAKAQYQKLGMEKLRSMFISTELKEHINSFRCTLYL